MLKRLQIGASYLLLLETFSFSPVAFLVRFLYIAYEIETETTHITQGAAS